MSSPVVEEAAVPEVAVVGRRKSDVGVVVTACIIIALAAAILFLPLSRGLIGTAVLVLTVAMMFIRIPVGIGMIVASSIGLYQIAGWSAVQGSVASVTFSALASWSFTVIPMFVLMAVLFGASGMTSSAFSSAEKWLARLPGGLALSTTFASAGLSAASGSDLAVTMAVGRTAIPEMMRAGYSPSLATGSVAMGAIGNVLPPSILLVIYAGVAETPVGPQLLAGVIPGVMLMVAFAVCIIVWVTLRPSAAPRTDLRYSWSERLTSLWAFAPVAIVIIVIIGGLYQGVFTATEAGAFGALTALVLGTASVLRKHRSGDALLTFLKNGLVETVSTVGALFLLLIGVFLLTRVMAFSGLAQAVADFVVDLGLTRVSFLLLLIPIYLILGMFLDTFSMMFLTLPVFMEPLLALDVNLIWFGVFLVIMAEIGFLTPPMGLQGFIVHSIAVSGTRDMDVEIKITDVWRGMTPFILATFGALMIMIFFPDLVMLLS